MCCVAGPLLTPLPPSPLTHLQLQAQQQARNWELRFQFLHSFTNTYSSASMKIEMVELDVLGSIGSTYPFNPALGAAFEASVSGLQKLGLEPPELRRRFVYHTCQPDVAPLICQAGLLPAQCVICRSGFHRPHDAGFFGNHSKGVYVSKHADYTFFYNRKRGVQVPAAAQSQRHTDTHRQLNK